ncbi:MAG: nucleoside-diphosphate kinase [Actinomycetota bacterium]|nr:nucleoside-diphosphate kinase [Actinomycetota bacterium]
MDSTFFMCKPDAVERGLVGEILSRLERRGLTLVRAELRQLDEAIAKAHYAEHDGKPFFGELVSFITRSKVLVCEVAGPKDTWAVVRTVMGATDPAKAAPGTIRGDLAIEIGENLVHGSDSAEAAARELALFFPEQ